jgi:hypothetical protein
LTPFESGLQHWNLGDIQSQQSWRALTPPSALGSPPQTSPSGLQLIGLRQRPIGGLAVESITHVTLPSPGSIDPAAPQQSESCWQRSPSTRQPAATWQTCPPLVVTTQTRLQQLLPPVHGRPSTMQLPAPVTWGWMQVPEVPLWIWQIPVQQSPAR